MASEQPTELLVVDQQGGLRLDVFLARMCPERSRVQLRRAITEGSVLVDGQHAKPAYRLNPGQRVRLELPALPRDTPAPEPMALEILYEDDDLAAINKPPGLVVHPSRGHTGGTLANALAHHFAQLSGVGGVCRPGIVHRLDRDTSGIVVVAKTDAAHMALAAQWEKRTIFKEYFAIVAGVPDRDRDRIDQPIGMHPHQREKMAIRAGHATSRSASTFYEVQERFAGFAALHVHPYTGRTHQIRVHLTHIGYPVLCDRIYGGRSQITLGELQHTDDATILLDRQALHASRLRLSHPRTGVPLELEAPLPDDLGQLQQALRRWCAAR
ncbi:MAG: RluA family pseudouridine synthase [Pirellulaceae bacterium]